MEQSEQLSLSLPYAEIEKLAVRDTLRKREDIKRGGKESWDIPFDSISIRENFNTRYEYEGIVEIADSMLSVGQLEEVYVDVLESGEIFIERGHRRYYGIKYNRDNNRVRVLPDGKIDDFSIVKCFINKSNMTEMQRILNLFGTNMHSKELKPLEQAETAWRLKYCLGEELSDDVIASKIGVSRQTVNNMILIAKADDSIKNEIKVGNMTFTNAVAFVRAQRKQSKEADKKEKESHETKATVNNEPEDPLKKEMQELADLEERTDEFKEREAAKAARDLERLLDIANEVLVNKDSLTPHIGKRFAAPAYGEWTEQVLDETSGELVPKVNQQLLLAKDQEVNDAAIEMLIANNAKSVFIYKVHTAAPSVFTELPEEREKGMYDLDREELKIALNVVKNIDWISVHAEKIQPEQTSRDFVQRCDWLQKDMALLLDWVNKNKKQNKAR